MGSSPRYWRMLHPTAAGPGHHSDLQAAWQRVRWVLQKANHRKRFDDGWWLMLEGLWLMIDFLMMRRRNAAILLFLKGCLQRSVDRFWFKVSSLHFLKYASISKQVTICWCLSFPIFHWGVTKTLVADQGLFTKHPCIRTNNDYNER